MCLFFCVLFSYQFEYTTLCRKDNYFFRSTTYLCLFFITFRPPSFFISHQMLIQPFPSKIFKKNFGVTNIRLIFAVQSLKQRLLRTRK